MSSAEQKTAAGRGTDYAAELPARAPTQRTILLLGTLCLALSAGASLLLVLEHLGGLSLPGCGAGGPCEQAANSVWGKLPLGRFSWPTAYVGLAYFLAALVAWQVGRAALPQQLRRIVRLAVVVSLGFLLVILLTHTSCSYCIAAHAGNLAFGILVERARRLRATGPAATLAFAVTLGVTTGLLALGDARLRARLGVQAEAHRAASTAQILAHGDSLANQPEPQGQPFTGRYRVGPAEAPIRIVVFTDYQCRECLDIEQQLQELYATRTDISIAIRHFPFNTDCNPHVTRTLHSNACWAARAAEAAGILWGAEGFWKMSGWLFERQGRFRTTAELTAGIRALGYDPEGFVALMTGNETEARIRADCDEAQRLGLFFTPMVFINGVELKGWMAPQALRRTVEEIAASHPPRRSARYDRPPSAHEKYLADWREQPRRVLPPDAQQHALGPDQARLRVVLWGDYREPITAQADEIIRSFVRERRDVRYIYRHYPLDPVCNPAITEARHAQACRAARAAEAAAQLAGADGFWRLHGWLMTQPAMLDDATLGAAVAEIGITPAAFFAALADSQTLAGVADDVAAGRALPSLRHGAPPGIHALPTIFVDERYVPRWILDDRPILVEILEAAHGAVIP